MSSQVDVQASCIHQEYVNVLKVFVDVFQQSHEYSETSIHRFPRGSEKETMDPGKQLDAGAIV
jgi:hypothetical protein